MPSPLYDGGDKKLPRREGGDKPLQNAPVQDEKSLTHLPAIEIRFEGDVSPEMILVPDLAEVIRAVQRLAKGRGSDESIRSGEEEKLRLIGVNRGSARYTLAGPPPAVAETRLRIVGDVIEHPDQIGENDYLLGPIRILSHASNKLKCTISIREPGQDGPILARIGPETYGELSRSVIITGPTEFCGKVERVGGATRSRCGLRVAFRDRMLICRVPSSKVARQLGENLYKRVVVTGEASWIRTTWKVVGFRVDSMRALKQNSITDKIQAIRDAGGKDWDEVADVREFLGIEESILPHDDASANDEGVRNP